MRIPLHWTWALWANQHNIILFPMISLLFMVKPSKVEKCEYHDTKQFNSTSCTNKHTNGKKNSSSLTSTSSIKADSSESSEISKACGINALVEIVRQSNWSSFLKIRLDPLNWSLIAPQGREVSLGTWKSTRCSPKNSTGIYQVGSFINLCTQERRHSTLLCSIKRIRFVNQKKLVHNPRNEWVYSFFQQGRSLLHPSRQQWILTRRDWWIELGQNSDHITPWIMLVNPHVLLHLWMSLAHSCIQ